MKSLLIIFLLLIVSFGIVCAGEKSEGEKPYFTMSADEKHKLIIQAKTIRIGDTYESVLSKLGQPTFDQIMMKKEREEIIGRSVKYYAVKREKGFTNEYHDQLIYIFFDKSDHVRDIELKIKDN